MTRFSFLAIGVITALAVPAIAQIPMPKATVPEAAVVSPQPQDAATPAPSSTPVVPDFDKDQTATEGDYIDKDGVEREAFGNIKLSPEDEAALQELHAMDREEAIQMGSFKWIPWDDAGPKVWEIVYKESPNWEGFIKTGLHKYIDVAIADIDRDNQPDVILWHWRECGSLGCLYKIYFGSPGKTSNSFIANILRPFEEGIMVDNGYFKY